MNLSDPLRSVVPSAHGQVLAVLARTEIPLSGRRVAELTDGAVGRSRAAQILAGLVRDGIVLVTDQPPSHLYVLNRDHVAASGITALTGQRHELLRRMRAHLGGWVPPPHAVWLFGSAARGAGGSDSDLDVVVVRPDGVPKDDAVWQDQVARFAEQAWRWSGNSCEVLEVSDTELAAMVAAGERLLEELRRDGVLLAGESVRHLLGPRVRR